MNSERDEKGRAEQAAERTAAGVGDAEAELDALMAEGSQAATEFVDGDVEARALEAAEEALEMAEQALAEARVSAGEEQEPPKRMSRRRELVLRGILVINFVLMGVMLALPGPPPATPSTEGELPGTAEPRVEPADPPTSSALPAGDLYTQALTLAADGRYDAAIEQMQEYLARAPHLPAPMRRSVYDAMSHYSFKIGRPDQALEYARQATAVIQSHFLPTDLIEMAHQAEQEGNADEMRRLYARFLLQQKQVPPALQRYVVEAYLKLGDSYRLEARAAAEEARIEELEELNRKFRQEQQQQEASGGEQKGEGR